VVGNKKRRRPAYFFSAELETAVLAGGAGFCGTLLDESPPIPRITSGMRLPPNKITMIAKTISQWIGLNSPIINLVS